MSQEKSKHPLGNIEKISSGVYIVRTQAGFNQALKEYKQETDCSHVQGYPRSYPSFVTFTCFYNGGGHTINAACVPLKKKKEGLEKVLALVIKHLGD